jgi:N-acetylglucosaminyldiphosphoundecaprenol N-acetyl-beta-D-mannosaminyltransferase
MIKQIEVMGIRLNNNYMREQMGEVEKLFASRILRVIELVSTDMMLEASQTPEVAAALNGADLSVMADVGLLEASGASTTGKRKEIKEQQFIRAFFQYLQKERKTIYLLGTDLSDIRICKNILLEQFPRLRMIGEATLDLGVEEADEAINRINSECPVVVCSILPTPDQEIFLMRHREKLNAGIWLGAGAVTELTGDRCNMLQRFRRRISAIRLQRIMAGK